MMAGSGGQGASRETRYQVTANSNKDGGESHRAVAVGVAARCHTLVLVPINRNNEGDIYEDGENHERNGS